MRVSFYIKLFIAFIIFAVLLLAFSTFAFNNFYSFHNEKKEKEIIENILNQQEEILKSYLKSYENKLFLIQNTINQIKNKDEIIEFLQKSFLTDKNILEFKIVDFQAQELLKIENNSLDINVVEKEKLKNIFTAPYFKEIRTLDKNRSLYFLDNSKNSFFINLIIRDEKEFLILKVDLSNIYEKISNDFLKKTFIYKNEDFLSTQQMYKKIHINNNQYLIFAINNNFDKNDFFRDYFEAVVVIGLCLAVFLSLLFSEPISKLNKKVEDEKEELDLNIKKNSLELSDNQRLINNHIMFLHLNKENVITEVSFAFSTFIGFSKAELIGHKYTMLLHKDTNKKEKLRIKKAIKNGNSYFGEIKGYKKDGTVFWINLFVEAIFDYSKKVIAYNVICTDITNKKKIEELYVEINNQLEQYDAIFENVNSGIALIDLDGNFIKVNRRFCGFLDYEIDELLKMNCSSIVSETSKNFLHKVLEELKEIGNIFNLEKIFVKKDGTFVHLELSLSLLLDKKHFVFVVNSLEDKRKLQELNQNLELKIQEEVEKSIQKDKLHQQEQIKNAKLTSIGSLAAGIAHEINTPLTYIKGNLELMQYDIDDLPEDEIKNRMKYDSEKMKEGINRIANIVESMREMSQSSKEVKENVNIYSTLVTSLTMAHNRSKQISKIFLNGKLFDIDSMDKNEETFISKVQKQRVEQVWIIIINNALDELIKIEDYEKRLFTINIYEEKGSVFVRFKDNAGGIPLEIIENIFEPFMSTKEHSGMGVGLNIAKKIVEEQEGKIVAYNEDKGAVFEVNLPIR